MSVFSVLNISRIYCIKLCTNLVFIHLLVSAMKHPVNQWTRGSLRNPSPSPIRATVAGINLAPLIRRPKPAVAKKATPSRRRFRLESEAWQWNPTNDLMLYRYGKDQPKSRIAAFDFDGCLVKTSLYRRQPEAWSILFPRKTKPVLRDLVMNGYKIVIISNQGGIGRARKSKDAEILKVKSRIEGFIREVQCEIEIPIDVILSTNKQSTFHKPDTGMWTFFRENLNGRTAVDMKNSFYVGDAAGRRTDFADSDAKFAKNTGLQFFNEKDFFAQDGYKRLLSPN